MLNIKTIRLHSLHDIKTIRVLSLPPEEKGAPHAHKVKLGLPCGSWQLRRNGPEECMHVRKTIAE